MRQTKLLPTLLLSAIPVLASGSEALVNSKGPVPRGSCAVCGMSVANFPDWAASIAFKDGTLAWFDGPRDLFIYLMELRHYAPKRNPADIAGIQVKDYYRLNSIDGQKAFYVLGSDVMGPMGKELVPFTSEAGARDFLRDHRGERVLTFREVTPKIMKRME